MSAVFANRKKCYRDFHKFSGHLRMAWKKIRNLFFFSSSLDDIGTGVNNFGSSFLSVICTVNDSLREMPEKNL